MINWIKSKWQAFTAALVAFMGVVFVVMQSRKLRQTQDELAATLADKELKKLEGQKDEAHLQADSADVEYQRARDALLRGINSDS